VIPRRPLRRGNSHRSLQATRQVAPCVEKTNGQSIGHGLGFGRVDFDAALELDAVIYAGRGNVDNGRAVLFDVDSVARVYVAEYLC
jgi:hypothetical protein